MDALIFNELFIEYLKGIFFENPDKKFPRKELGQYLPEFYRESILLSAGIGYLQRRGIILQTSGDGDDIYYASPIAVKQHEDEIENTRLNTEIDIEIKKETLQRLKWDRWQKKYWYIIPTVTILFSAVLSGIASYLVYYFTHS